MVTSVFMAKTPCHARSHEGPEPLWSAVGDVDSSGHVRKAHEDVEVESAVGVPRLRGGEDLPEHLTPPDHRPEHRRAHARRLEDLTKIRRLIRIRERSSVAERYNSFTQAVSYNVVAHIPLEQPDETPDTLSAR